MESSRVGGVRCILVLMVVFTLLSPATLFAWRVGDRVEVEFMGGTYEGVVLEAPPNGLVRVQIERDGRTYSPRFPADRLRAAGGGGLPAAPAEGGGQFLGEFDPVAGDRVVYEWGSHVYPAVVGARDGGWADLHYLDEEGVVQFRKTPVSYLKPEAELDRRKLTRKQQQDPYGRLERAVADAARLAAEVEAFDPQVGDRAVYRWASSVYPAMILERDGTWVTIRYVNDEGLLQQTRTPANALAPAEHLDPKQLKPKQSPADPWTQLTAPEKALVETTRAGVRQLSVDGVSSRWQGDNPPPASLSRLSATIALPAGDGAIESVVVNVGDEAASLAVAYAGKGEPRAQLVDLAQGRATPSIVLPQQTHFLDVSPDGERLALRSEGSGFGERSRVDLATRRGDRVEVVLSFKPYGEEESAVNRDVNWARFVGDDRLATLSRNGVLTIWSLPILAEEGEADVAPEALAEMQGVSAPTILPGGDAILLSHDRKAVLLEVGGDASPAPAAAIDLPIYHVELASSVDGRRWVARSGARVLVIDPQAGRIALDIGLPEVSGASILVTDAGVLLQDAMQPSYLLLDSTDGTPRHRYTFPASSEPVLLGSRLGVIFPLAGSAGRPLKIVELASPERAMTPATDVFALQPGDRIAIREEFDADAQAKSEIRQSLQRSIESQGFSISNDGELVLTLTSRNGEAVKMEYRQFGGGQQEITAHARENVAELRRGDVVLWRSVSTWRPPMMMSIPQGESIQTVIERQRRESIHAFAVVDLPDRIVSPAALQACPTSEVTLQGVKPLARP